MATVDLPAVLTGAQPAYVAVTGDWHGNELWSVHAVNEMLSTEFMSCERAKAILHCGDLGLWPYSPWYVNKIGRELDARGAYLLFADGNHEWHTRLAELHANGYEDVPVPVDKSYRVWHLPRGYRWSWHNKNWVAVGGAGSPDYKQRIIGKSWWPEELLTPVQADNVITDGSADVILAHDCPLDWLPPLGKAPHWWDLDWCHKSARELQRVTDALQPELLVHGHLHVTRDDEYEVAPGKITRVTGLDADGTDGNWRVLNVCDLTWVR